MEEINAFTRLIDTLHGQPVLTLLLILGSGYLIGGIRIGSFSLGPVAVALLLSVMTSPATADEVIMKNGDRLTGEVIKMHDGLLEFKTSYAGKITLNWEQVQSLRLNSAAITILKDDTITRAKRVEDRSSDVYQSNSESFASRDIKFINPDPWRTGEGVTFTGNLNLGFKAQRGNTDKDELNIDGRMQLRRHHDRFRLAGEYEADESNNIRTDKNWTILGSYAYFTGSKFYYAGNIFMENDDFSGLDLRLSVGPSLGYQFFEGKNLNLSVEAGTNYVSEEFKTQKNNKYWAARWYVDYDQYFLDRLFQVFHRQQGLWNFENNDDLNLTSRTGLRFPLVMRFTATAEVAFDYDKDPPPDKKEKDTTTWLKLGYTW